MFSRALGGPGPLQTINIPIGILMFSACGRQDTPKPQKKHKFNDFRDLHWNLAHCGGIYVI